MTIIVVGNDQYTTSLLPDEQSDHGHEELEMGDSTLKDGQIILKEDPPPDGIYIACKKGEETVFKVGTDGAVDCETLLSTQGFKTINHGAMVSTFPNHVIGGSQNYIRVGRQRNFSEEIVGLLDGIEHKREIDGAEQEFQQQLHPSVPKLSISGTTNEHVNWMEIKDSDTDNTVFAVHSDGTIQCEGWENPALELPDNHNHSLSVEANSLFIGASKISIKNGFVSVYHLKAPPYIPKILRDAPYNLTASNIDATIVRSINDWMRLARSTLGGVSAKSLRLRHIFDVENHDEDFETTIGFPDHLNNRTELTADRVICDQIRPKSGNALDRIRVKNLLAGSGSVWLGERLHISTENGRALLLYRKQTIPKYLLDLGVVEQDVLNIPSTIATLTLEQIEALSVAQSGSDDLSVIFPYSNVLLDFDASSVFNEIQITPTNNSSSSGLTISQPSGGHPLIDFKGSPDAGAGYGLLQFGDQNSAKSLIYSSRADECLHIDQLANKVKISAQALDLSSGCALTRDGVSIEGSDSPITDLVYVDSVYSGAVENGSVLKPYKSLSGALQAKLADASTTSYVFKLAPGVYTGGISIDQSAKNQSFKIEGCGDETIIQSGTTFAAGKDTNVLYFRDFKTIELASCTIRNGLYGFYPRACDKVICHDVKFENLGSDGTVNRHNLAGTQAEQAAFWASTSTSSGGACRIRDIGELEMYDCEVSYCLRGLRIQDVGTSETNSIVSNCKVFRTAEAGIYLAAGDYTGNTGCINFSVTGCFLTECGNDGLLCIGGKKCSFTNNTVVRSANAGFQAWHSLDLTVKDNSFFDCNLLSYNLIGNDGDAFGTIVIDGNSNIGTGDYMAVIQGNQMTKCNQGRHASAIVGINVRIGAYPSASNKIIIDGNFSDAAVRIQNDNSIPITEVSSGGAVDLSTHTATELSDISNSGSGSIITVAERTKIGQNETAIAGKQDALSFGTVDETDKVVYSQNIKSYCDGMCSNLGATSMVESTGSSSFSVKSTNPLISGTEQIKMNFVLDRSGTTNDYEYRWHNHYGKLLFTQIKDSSDRGIYGIDDDTGCVTLAGGRYSDSAACSTDLMRQWTGPPTDLSLQVLGRASFRSGVRLPVNVTPASATASGVQGDINIDDDNLWVRNATNWKKVPLNAFDYTAPSGGGPVVVRSTANENPGGYANWPNLDPNITLLSVEHQGSAGAIRRKMPLNPPDGMTFDIIAVFNLGVCILYHSGDSSPNNYFTTSSLGYNNNVMCSINLATYPRVRCYYLGGREEWFVTAF